MQFETVLNLAWLLLGAVALACTTHSVFRRKLEEKHAPAWLHIVGVALIIAALFPYISATDDIVRVEHFSSQHQPHHTGKHNQTDNLVRLYETMDTPWMAPISTVVLVFFFVSLIFTPSARLVERIAPFESGRSPPLGAA